MRFRIIASLAVLAACAGNPATGVESNNGLLRVQYSSGTGTYVSNDVVGTDVHRDENGNEIGSTDHLEARQHSYEWSDWKYFQGPDELDEQDFYRIAGDKDAENKVDMLRASAARKMKIGMPLMIAGYAAMIVLSAVGKSSGNDTVASLGYIGGTAAGTIGGLVWYWGKAEMENRHHLPMSRADKDADVIEECRERRCHKLRGGRTTQTGER